VIGNRSRSLRHVNVGQTVTRVVAGGGPTRLRVTSVDRRLIHCGDLTFERDLGLEVDPVLGPSLWGAVHSRLQPEPRRVVVRGAVSLQASIRRVLQIMLFVTYLIVLAGIGVAIGFHRYPLALALGAGLVLIWVAMKLVASLEDRTLHARPAHQGRRSGEET
jgi:hypothetical protein